MLQLTALSTARCEGAQKNTFHHPRAYAIISIMQARIHAIHHNCFCIAASGRMLVFDWPAPDQRPAEAATALTQLVTGQDAIAAFSHSHGDHCSADIRDILAVARSSRYILSDDVPDMVPELDLPGATIPDPGDPPPAPGPWTRVDDGVSVSAMASNDIGAAFLIHLGGWRIYYGGDLADWIWPEAGDAANAFTAEYFSAAIEHVRAFAPHIALTNCDPRLPGLSGAARFADAVRPACLVPMHSFGNTAHLPDFAQQVARPGMQVFAAARLGESCTITVDAPADAG